MWFNAHTGLEDYLVLFACFLYLIGMIDGYFNNCFIANFIAKHYELSAVITGVCIILTRYTHNLSIYGIVLLGSVFWGCAGGHSLERRYKNGH